MGMDLLDVTFRIQKNIGLTITPEDWQQLCEAEHDCTVGQIYDLLLQKQGIQDFLKYDIAANARLWDALQSEVATSKGLPPVEVQLHTPFQDIFPKDSAREDWNHLSETASLRIPSLQHPRWFAELGVVATLATIVSVPLTLFLDGRYVALFLIGALGSLITWQISDQMRYVIPQSIRTMKDLCRRVRDVNLGFFADTPARTTDEAETWEGLKEALVDGLGVDDDEVVRDAWLVKDLGCE